MSNTLLRKWTLVVGVLCACIPSASLKGALVLSDDFAYADSTALRVNWKDVVAGQSPDFNDTFFFADSASGLISASAAQRPATLNNQTLMGLNGRSTYRELGLNLSTDFTLTARLGANAYSRTIQIGLGDSNGAGYSWTWNAAQPTGSGGNGVFNIREQTAWAGAPAVGATLSANVNGFSPPTRYALPSPILGGDGRINYSTSDVFLGYTELKLTWQASTGLMNLYQDGALLSSATDTTYNTFSRLYIGGGNRSFIDNVTLEAVPEPGAVWLVGSISVVLASRRVLTLFADRRRTRSES